MEYQCKLYQSGTVIIIFQLQKKNVYQTENERSIVHIFNIWITFFKIREPLDYNIFFFSHT